MRLRVTSHESSAWLVRVQDCTKRSEYRAVEQTIKNTLINRAALLARDTPEAAIAELRNLGGLTNIVTATIIDKTKDLPLVDCGVFGVCNLIQTILLYSNKVEELRAFFQNAIVKARV